MAGNDDAEARKAAIKAELERRAAQTRQEEERARRAEEAKQRGRERQQRLADETGLSVFNGIRVRLFSIGLLKA
jgi:hypothetical protein